MITLKNLTSVSQSVYSADGDAVMIPPQAQIETEEKFLWNIDKTKVRQIGLPPAKPVSVPAPEPTPVVSAPAPLPVKVSDS